MYIAIIPSYLIIIFIIISFLTCTLQGSLNTFQKQHPLRDRARKLHLGILVIRFEMPFNVWCDHCNVVCTVCTVCTVYVLYVLYFVLYELRVLYVMYVLCMYCYSFFVYTVC